MIKPYYGHLLPRMSDVNNRIENQIEGWRELLGEPVPAPGKIDGHRLLGAQVGYHFGENYFLTLNVSHYEEKVQSEFTPAPDRFYFERQVEFYDVTANLQYYFDYDSASRLNKYLGIGVGILFAKARSNTQSTFISNPKNGTLFPPSDTRGDFSGNSLLAAVSAGLDVRLFNPFSLWAEAGYQFANIGHLEGTVNTFDGRAITGFTTNTSFDFSGFYFRAGLGIGLSF